MAVKNETEIREEREQLTAKLLSALGWLTCYFPIGSNIEEWNEESIMNGVRAGNLQGAIEKIRECLLIVGHDAATPAPERTD